jgi:hypothetical protein
MPLRWLLVAALALTPVTTHLRAQLRSDLPAPVWQPIGERVAWGSLSFIVPPGMKGKVRTDLYEMAGPGVRGRDSQCSIFIVGAKPSRGDLATFAQTLLLGTLTARVYDTSGGSNFIGYRRVGRSADGWRYVELNGRVDSMNATRIRVMLIDRGATVIPIIGIAEPGNGCVGLNIEATPNENTVTWSALFYSLKLVGDTASASNHLREQVIGHWEGSGFAFGGSAGMLQDEVFEPNGRYGGAGMDTVGPGRPLSSSTGRGSYVVEANKLALFPNAGNPEAYLIRVVEDYSPTTPGEPTVQLCKMSVDAIGLKERCLSRR